MRDEGPDQSRRSSEACEHGRLVDAIANANGLTPDEVRQLLVKYNNDVEAASAEAKRHSQGPAETRAS